MVRPVGRPHGLSVAEYARKILAESPDPNAVDMAVLTHQVRKRMRADGVPLLKTDIGHAVSMAVYRLREPGTERIDPEKLAPYRNGPPTAGVVQTPPAVRVPAGTAETTTRSTRYVVVEADAAPAAPPQPVVPPPKKDDPFAFLSLPDANAEKCLRITREYCDAVGGPELAEKWVKFWAGILRKG